MRVNYQKITVNGVTYVDGINRMSEYLRIFETRPIGKTILDVGCHNGFYGIQAVRDGALYYLGIDKSKSVISIGVDVVKKLGLKNIELVVGDILIYPISRSFDVSLCLNVLHHFSLESAIEIVKKMAKVTKERMVFVVIPSDKKTGLVRESRRRRPKLGFSTEFFAEQLPGWVISSQSTTVEPKNRMIIEPRR